MVKIILGVYFIFGLSVVWAENSLPKPNQSVEPYIEKLRKEKNISTPSKQAEDQYYLKSSVSAESPQKTDAQKKQDSTAQPYLDSYQQKYQPSNPNHAVQPYLETVKAGKELEPKFKKMVDQAAGIAVVASNRFDVSSDKVQGASFETVYQTQDKYSPGIDVFYERQFIRKREWGAIGLVGHLNYITTKGKGVFIRNQSTSDDTRFRFHVLAMSLAASYRLVVLRFINPFAQFGFAGIPFIETRNDNKPSAKGISRSLVGVLGVALNLDWISRSNAWNQYDSNEVLHTYLTGQYEFYRTFASAVKFNYNAWYAGLMFEF